MRIKVQLTGTTPLMMHNERLSDPDDKYAKQIKEITSKRTNQTEKDKELVSKLEWFGGLYTNGSNELIIPTQNLVKCFRDAAAVTKEGRKVARGISPLAIHYPLVYDGPKDLQKLYELGPFADRRQVKVGGRVKRTRPIFPKWAVVSEFELLIDVLDFGRLSDIIELAGRSTGLGDARILGYGRFKAEVAKN